MQATARSRTRGARAAVGAACLSAVVLAAGCASPVVGPGGSDVPTASEAPGDRIHEQARAALVRWADAVRESGGASITFVGELTSQIGDWEPENGGNKAALMAGAVEASKRLSTERPSRKEVNWLDGTKVEVGVVSAQAALDALIEGGADNDCKGCVPLIVTEANLATALVETSHGPAEAPVWVFTIAGTSVRVTRVAVDESVTVKPPPWNADDPPIGISIDSAIGNPDSRKLTVSFTGAVNTAAKPCGADYEAEALESELAVVVIIHEMPNPAAGACEAVGKTRTAEVTLDAKLKERAVLEVKQGLPVPVTRP
jgi:hypothetical protein